MQFSLSAGGRKDQSASAAKTGQFWVAEVEGTNAVFFGIVYCIETTMCRNVTLWPLLSSLIKDFCIFTLPYLSPPLLHSNIVYKHKDIAGKSLSNITHISSHIVCSICSQSNIQVDSSMLNQYPLLVTGPGLSNSTKRSPKTVQIRYKTEYSVHIWPKTSRYEDLSC